MSYSRFAIYYLPPDGALARAGAAWLGWDAATGRTVVQPNLPGLHDMTMTPRKYGFHGTLKPPFRLRDSDSYSDSAARGRSLHLLADAVDKIASACPPARCDGLALGRLGRFLALTPIGDTTEIARVAETVLRGLDRFRAPPLAAELERRRASRLSARQAELLAAWGYPYVLEEFRFHMTLTGTLPPAQIAHWIAMARQQLPAMPAPFVLDQIALTGERRDGMFELIQRYTLSG